MQKSTLSELETLFLALGDKTRIKLLALMAEGPVAVGLLADRLNESQPKVSRHLAYLRNADIVSTERDGKWIYYGINYPEDASLRRILDTVIQSIAVMRIDGEDVYFTETVTVAEEVLGPEADIYAEAYESADDDYHLEDDVAEQTAIGQDEDELDVFLL